MHLFTRQLHPLASSGKEMPEITEPRSPKNVFASCTLQAETAEMSPKQMRSNNKIIFAIDESLDGATFGIMLNMTSIK
jgi:hypothetical protein